MEESPSNAGQSNAGNETAAVELTKEAAQAQLAEMKSGAGDQSLWLRHHAGDVKAVEQVRGIYAAAFTDGRPMTPEERQALDTFGAPADPSVYEINYALGRALNEDEQAADGNFRHWLHSAGVSKSKGEFLAEVAQKEAPRFAAMSPEQRAAHGEQVLQQIMRLPDGAAKLEAAVRLVDEIERVRPGLKAWLEHTGLGNSYELVATLAQHAHRRGKTR
jgi:hypothetical protein